MSSIVKFSPCEIDKLIELTLNRDTKGPGATTGFSTNTNAERMWEINASYWASLRRVFHQHLQYKFFIDHEDLSPGRILKEGKGIPAVLTDLLDFH